MGEQSNMANTVEIDSKWLYRACGIATMVFAISYFVMIGLYAIAGGKSSGAEGWLRLISNHQGTWWGILALSVFTDLLLVLVALALYNALRATNHNAMLLATAFIGLFIILDLALTWTNYAALISLSANYASAASEAQKATLVTAAIYPATVVDSNLLFVYNTLTLSVGILIAGIVMLPAGFSKLTAYLGLATGALGILAVATSFFASTVSDISIYLASFLTLLWALFLGIRLFRHGSRSRRLG